jgi:predicted glycogen debranching enzyme
MRADSLIESRRCRDFGQSSRLEWLDTNGRGGYMMGTVAGVRTRRYHSLLTAPGGVGQGAQVWLSAIEDALELEGERYELATHYYPGTLSPRGYERLSEFRLAPYPCWLYSFGESTLAKEVLLIEDRAAVLLRYCCSEDARLRLRPFLAGRPQHELLRAGESAGWEVEDEPGYWRFRRGRREMHLRGDFRGVERQPDWYHSFQYPVDYQRGLDYEEDLWTPGVAEVELRADTWAYFVCSLGEDPGVLDPLELMRVIEVKEKRFPLPHSLGEKLANAAEHFVFEQGGRKSVIAGYPWFTDWGRDTFISLPGLMLARGRQEEAARTIDSFVRLRRGGLIPNRITDDGATAEYNSIDGTLWLVIAVWQWLEEGGDREHFEDELYEPLREMMERLVVGTEYGIYCDGRDGLLVAGSAETQLTWMDARVKGRPVTPRHGKAVEINALWYNALRLMTDWARSRGDYEAEGRFGGLANRAIAGFTGLFWNEAANCLYDVVREGYRDGAIRPNQLFALSLPYPMVIRSKAEAMLRTVEEHLLTANGLRTLSPGDAGFEPRFEGGPERRDGAYHQGTVWPWLFGPYGRACLKVRGQNPGEKQRLRDLLEGFAGRALDSGCLGQIGEVYDGTEPQREGGTPAQAWSVAEILWLLSRELAS